MNFNTIHFLLNAFFTKADLKKTWSFNYILEFNMNDASSMHYKNILLSLKHYFTTIFEAEKIVKQFC